MRDHPVVFHRFTFISALLCAGLLKQIALSSLAHADEGLVGNEALTCRPAQMMLTQAREAAQAYHAALYALTGDEAQAYLDVINAVEPRTNFHASIVFGIANEEGAVFSISSDDGHSLCMVGKIPAAAHAEALARAKAKV